MSCEISLVGIRRSVLIVDEMAIEVPAMAYRHEELGFSNLRSNLHALVEGTPEPELRGVLYRLAEFSRPGYEQLFVANPRKLIADVRANPEYWDTDKNGLLPAIQEMERDLEAKHFRPTAWWFVIEG